MSRCAGIEATGSEDPGSKGAERMIKENLQRVEERIHRACAQVGRDPSEVRLIAVSKTVDVERIREGVAAGIRELGENYVQEARKKIAELAELPVTWHYIGHLQTNKARFAVELFSWIHTVDRKRLAEALDRRAEKVGKRLSVLIQVHLGDEETKAGVEPGELFTLCDEVDRLQALELKGLMVLPPYLADPEVVRPYFRHLRELLEQVRQRVKNPEAVKELSMGMSHDFEVAIEEGATMVRVGTALFGKRPGCSVTPRTA